MFFPCLPLLLRPPHSDNSGFHGAGKGGDRKQIEGEPHKQDSVLFCKGRGQDVTHRHLRTSALCKSKNIVTTAGQCSTLNAISAVTKGFRNEKREHQDRSKQRFESCVPVSTQELKKLLLLQLLTQSQDRLSFYPVGIKSGNTQLASLERREARWSRFRKLTPVCSCLLLASLAPSTLSSVHHPPISGAEVTHAQRAGSGLAGRHQEAAGAVGSSPG